MEYRMPVQVFEGQDCVYQHRQKLADLGKKAMVVTGRNSAKRNGALADVERALREVGVELCIFDEVEENPSVDTVLKAGKIAREQEVSFVIGIGGGSPMDAAKAIAVVACEPDADVDFLYHSTGKEPSLPIVEIPTTCGTGAEVTPNAVLTDHGKHKKGSIAHRVYPVYALVDAGYLKAAPASVIRNTAADALAHLLESYVNADATEYSRMFVREGLETFARSKDALMGERELADSDLWDLIHASTLAGMAIAHTGTSLPHALSYKLTYEKQIPHGRAVAYFLPGYLEEAKEQERTFLLARAGFSGMDEFYVYIKGICGTEKIPEELLEENIQSMLQNAGKLKKAPFSVDEDSLRRQSDLERIFK